MLIGEYQHTLDPKKRLSLPAKFRKELGKTVIVTRGLDHCLFVFSAPAWKKLAAKFSELSIGSSDTRGFNRFMLSGAIDTEVDSAGRILIPDYLKDFAGLKTDVVVADIFLPPATTQAFERLGVRVETVGIASSVAESEQQVTQLARLAGHPERGAALNARIEAALDGARPASGTRPVSTLLWQQGGIVAGPGSLIAELMQRTGLASHSAARGLGQGAYLPLEQVLADPPELVLAAGGERALAHPALASLEGTAYRRFDPSLLFCGGPTIVRAAGDLAAIRKDLFSGESQNPGALHSRFRGRTEKVAMK